MARGGLTDDRAASTGRHREVSKPERQTRSSDFYTNYHWRVTLAKNEGKRLFLDLKIIGWIASKLSISVERNLRNHESRFKPDPSHCTPRR